MLGIADDEVMVYFLGRLSFFDKAFPQAMSRAVEAAQQRTGVKTHLVFTGWFPEGDSDRLLFEEAARRYAPSVPITFLDGNDASTVADCWAAGLPLVVSDWDGYRSIVREGIDGFLIPTLGSPGGPLGETLALAHSMDLLV